MSNFDTKFINFLTLLLVLGLMSGLSACQPMKQNQIAPTKDQSIIGGQSVDPTSQFASRVLFLALGVEKKKTPFGVSVSQKSYCTATAISKKIILTAAHCVQNLKPSEAYIVLSIDPWGHPLNEKEWMAVEKIKIHEKFINHENQIENDLALLKLAKELPDERVSKIASNDQVSELIKTSAMKLVAIGYGKTFLLEKPITEQPAENFKLNYVMKSIEKFEAENPILQIDQGDSKGVCQGDSGGPGYIFDADKKEFFILGVTSYVSIFETEVEQRDPNKTLNKCIGHGNYTNVLLFRQWITQSIQGLL